MAQPRLKFWGWGYEGEALAPEEVRWLEGAWAQQFRVSQFELTPPPTADEIRLRPSLCWLHRSSVRKIGLKI
jgi:alkyldihydroxyacetonephosphate synthase